jgi:hypothetical protein
MCVCPGPQKSGLFRVSTAPKPSTFFSFERTGPRPTGAHFTPSKKAVLEHFVMVGDGKGSQFMHLLRNALHLTLQARCHLCPGCHFELKQVGFTAAYRPRQCVRTSTNTFFPIFRAGLLEPHGSESCTWQNRDLIQDTMHVLTQHPDRVTTTRSRAGRLKEPRSERTDSCACAASNF